MNPLTRRRQLEAYQSTVRVRMFAVLLGCVGILTLLSFWALYFWTLLLAMLLPYIAYIAYTSTTHRESDGFWGGPIMSILFVVAVLGCAGEVLCGLLLAILGSDSIYTVFQIIGAITGVISLVLLGLLRTMMWHRESPQWGVVRSTTVLPSDPYGGPQQQYHHNFAYPHPPPPPSLQEPRHLPRWGSPYGERGGPVQQPQPWHVVPEGGPIVPSGGEMEVASPPPSIPYARRANNNGSRSPTRRRSAPRVLQLDPNRNPYIAQPMRIRSPAPPPTQQYQPYPIPQRGPFPEYPPLPPSNHAQYDYDHNEYPQHEPAFMVSPSRRSQDSLYPERR